MASICRQPCCATPRTTVSELLERGLQRNRAAMPADEGPACADADGNFARFAVATARDRIGAIGFRATSCATLLAYCEWLAETAPGQRLAVAASLTSRDLIDALPGVPIVKRGRAVLAVAAFRSALANLEIASETS